MRAARLGLGALAALAAATAGACAGSADGAHHSPAPSTTGSALAASGTRAPAAATVIALGGPLPGAAPVRPGFLGLSIEYSALERLLGDDPHALDTPLLGLIAALSPGAAPVLRVGGDSSDWAWWPVPGMAKPGGVRIALGPRFASVLAAVTRALGAKLILGLDLEAHSRALAGYEAHALVRRLPPGSVLALEPGNEPELYGSFAWYLTRARKPVHGRPRGYALGGYLRELAALRPLLGAAAVAGPASGSARWFAALAHVWPRVRLGMLTLHRYPLQQCFVARDSPRYPSAANLLSAAASDGLAAGVSPLVRLAHRRGIPVRIDEINTISCGGGAVAQQFPAALWALDAMFAFAREGVDGVNVHTYHDAPYSLFRASSTAAGGWRVKIAPEYWGLRAFVAAAPPGSRLLAVHAALPGRLRAWATRAPNGTRTLVLLNVGPATEAVAVRSGRSASVRTLTARGRLGAARALASTSGSLRLTLGPRSAALIAFAARR